MLFRLACYLLVLVPFCTARVITWTAYSKDSQAAADEEAIAGIAKQISAQVDASTTVAHNERDVGALSETSKSIQTQNSIRSEVFLKGIRLQMLPKKGKNFGTTATLDLDELTSNYRFELESIQREVSDIELHVQKDLDAQFYAEANRLLSEIPHKKRQYRAILDEMSIYTTLDNSMRLKSNSTLLEESLIRELRELKIQVVDEKSFTIKVKKNEIAVPHFILTAEHNGKPIAKVSTDSNGIAIFEISPQDLISSPHELVVISELPLNLRNAAAIQPITLHYQINFPRCKLNISCKATPTTCAAIFDKISDTFGQIEHSTQSSITFVQVQATPMRSLKNLTSYNTSLTLSHKEKHCQWTNVGTGRTEEEATAAAIKTMNMDACLQTLDLCQ